MNNLDALYTGNLQDMSTLSLVINFVSCAILSLLLRAYYVRFSTTVSGKNHLGAILPLLSLIIFLVIVVVKSSLALSLGLVGALSIVRFRTPIKEPEELVYLFLAIALGLGFGAGFTVLTIAACLSILLFAYLFLSARNDGVANEYNLVVSWQDNSIKYEDVLRSAMRSSSSARLLRLSDGPVEKTCVFEVAPNHDANISTIMSDIRELSDELNIELFEATTNW